MPVPKWSPKNRTPLLLAALLALALAAPARAEERILHFLSELTIFKDSRILVRETIKVRAEQNRIVHGIKREFPSQILNFENRTPGKGVRILQVLLDGQPAPHRLRTGKYDRTLFIGDKDQTLPAGEYTYTIVYEANRQFQYGQDYDRLRWPVTGLTWGMPIDKVVVVVTPPQGIELNDGQAYLDNRIKVKTLPPYRLDQKGRLFWETSDPLPDHHEVRVYLEFPPNRLSLPPPPPPPPAWGTMSDWQTWVAFAGMVLILLWYVPAWRKVGKDPEGSNTGPLFEPPPRVSPAAARYLLMQTFDRLSFGGALANLAVKKHLTVEIEENHCYLHHSQAPDALPLLPGEEIALQILFRDGERTQLARSNDEDLGKALAAARASLGDDLEEENFISNHAYTFPGWMLALLTFGGIVLVTFWPQAGWGVLGGLLALGLGAIPLSFKALRSPDWREACHSLATLAGVLGGLAGSFIFAGMREDLRQGAWILVGSLVLLNGLFEFLLRAPTDGSRKLMDRLEGYKAYLYMSQWESDKLKDQPPLTPELFERHLPYALALKVEQRWCMRFADVADKIGPDAFRPAWYRHPGQPTPHLYGLALKLDYYLVTVLSDKYAPHASLPVVFGGGGGRRRRWLVVYPPQKHS